MDFDYYFKKYDEEYGFNDSEVCGFEIGFKAGQQSKQAEIDVLKVRILEIINSYASGSDTDYMGEDIRELLK